MRRLLLIAALLFPSGLWAASNLTTAGTVTLYSTFECISVKAAYSGDGNNNNSLTVQYRVTGNTTWLNCDTPYIDRRATVNIQGSSVDNSAYVNQGRVSIVGLAANTSYDVLTTWSDVDGITGSASATNTVTTLSYSPPTGGTTRWVDASVGSEGNGTSGSPWKTITNAIQQSTAGDIITVKAGSYVPFTITKSGNSGAWFKLITNGNDAVTITGGAGVTHAMTVSADFWVIQGLIMAQCDEAGLYVNGAHFAHLVGITATNQVISTVVDTGAVSMNNSSNIYLLNGTFNTSNSDITNSTSGNIDLIELAGASLQNIVISSNSLTGGWDSIGNRNNSDGSGLNGFLENTDICHNSMTNWIDDFVEMDGGGPNLRVFGNHGRKTVYGFSAYGGSLMSDAGCYDPPNYCFRNDVKASGSNGNTIGIKHGHSTQGTRFYHNTFVQANSGGNEANDDSGDYTYPSTNNISRNNIYQASGNVWYHMLTDSNDYDYDVGYSSNGAAYADSWSGNTYTTLANFQSATSLEAHGKFADPSLNSDLTIPSNSNAVDAGVVINNFNDASSAWPYAGSGPDAGFSEYGAGGGGGPPAVTAGTRGRKGHAR